MNDNIIYELLHRIKNPWCWSFTLYFTSVPLKRDDLNISY